MNPQYPSQLLEKAVHELGQLPGVGSKTALSYALFLLRQDAQTVSSFVSALTRLKEEVHYCRDCHNIGDTESRQDLLTILTQSEKMNGSLQVMYWGCSFRYYQMIGNYSKATNYMYKLDRCRHNMSDAIYISYMISKFHFQAKKEKFKDCEIILQEIKLKKKFFNTIRYQYLSKVLNNYLYDKTIYLEESEFSQSPIILYQLKVLQSMTAKDFSSAQKYWKILQELNPKVYLDNYQLNSSKNLFSFCLRKHCQSMVDFNKIKEIHSSKNKGEILISILRRSHNPIFKEELFLLVWNTPCKNKNDLALLHKLINRFRTKGYNIVYKSGAYMLEDNRQNLIERKSG